MNVAREGQHSGKESTASAKVVPRAASSRRTLGIFATSVSAWSSVMTTRMFGRPSRPAVTGRAWSAPGSPSRASVASVAGAHAERRLFNPPANLHRVTQRRRVIHRASLTSPPPPVARRASRLLLEHQAVVVQQLALEADAVGAHARGEGEAEVGAGEPTGDQPELEQRLAQARRREPPAPLADGLDVVEPPARARDQTEVRLGGADDLFLAEGKPGAGELAPHEGDVPRVGVSRGADVDLVDGDHVAPEDHRLKVEAARGRPHARDVAEELAIDLLLAPGAVLLD